MLPGDAETSPPPADDMLIGVFGVCMCVVVTTSDIDTYKLQLINQ